MFKLRTLNMSENNEMSKLEAVKELIFGQNMQDYDQRFSDVDGQVERIDAEASANIKLLKSLIDELENSMSDRITSLETALNHRMDELDDAKADRQKLGKMLMNIGEKLQA